MTQASTFDLYHAALAADAAFQAALVRAFGKDAAERRYDMDNSSHPDYVREACARKLAADKAWLEAFRAAQAANREGAAA